MARRTQHKQGKRAELVAEWRGSFAAISRSADLSAARAEAAIPQKLSAIFEPHLTDAWRPLDSYKPKIRSSRLDRLALDAARHLFGKHPVPRILWQAWSSAPAKGSAVDGRAWFIAIGLGRSFLKTCAKGILTRREAHLFLACPHDLLIEQALHWAVARAAGASDGDALRICRSKIHTLPFNDFWRGAARFFAANQPASPQQASDLCDFFSWRRREDPKFDLFGNGYNIASLIVRMESWHRDMARSKAMGSEAWAGVDIPDWTGKLSSNGLAEETWRVAQILSSKALAAEGNAMRHCVLSYKGQCMSGQASIWSLSIEEFGGIFERKLTIEVNNRNREIVQIRGLANRSARDHEMRAARLWARASDLSFGRYC